MGPMCRERNPCGAWHVRIKPKCTRGAVVSGFAIRVGAARLLSRDKDPLRMSSRNRRPPQRHGDPLEQCTLNLSLSSCDSPARPDGSARARRPPQGGWRPGIKESLGNWRIVLRVLLLLQWICQAEPMPTRVACTPCSSWPEQVRGGWHRSTHAEAEPKQTRGSTHDATSHNSTTRARPRARDGSP